MKSEGYNGWKNYETWNVALWCNNTEDFYHRVRQMRTRCGKKFRAQDAKEIVGAYWPLGTPDFSDRGMEKAYRKVQWSAIADCINEF